jgi:hypothetical protein
MSEGAAPHDLTQLRQRSSRRRRIIALLVVVDAIVVAIAVGVWFAIQRTEPSELRGSTPPAGQVIPDLSNVSGVEPPIPPPSGLAGDAVTMIVGTCLNCRSGDLIGGTLARMLERESIPKGANIVVLGWDGDAKQWRREWQIPSNVTIHSAVSDRANDELPARLRLGENGMVFLYDRKRRWRSSFHTGQLDHEDMAHDLRLLATEDVGGG